MTDTVWIETMTSSLVNLNKIAFIKTITHTNSVEIIAGYNEDVVPLVLAVVDSQLAAQKFIHSIGKLIKTNTKCIDATLIAEYCNNDN